MRRHHPGLEKRETWAIRPPSSKYRKSHTSENANVWGTSQNVAAASRQDATRRLRRRNRDSRRLVYGEICQTMASFLDGVRKPQVDIVP